MKLSSYQLLKDVYSYKFLKFFLVGSLGYFSSIAMIYVMTDQLRFHYIVSWQIAWFLGNFLTFYFNKRYTFESSKKRFWAEIWRYYLVNSSSLFISLCLIYTCVDIFKIPYLLASVIVSFALMFYNFILHKKWSFK